MEATSEKKKSISWWWLLFIIILWPHSSSTTKSSSDRAREFLVGRWTYYNRSAKLGERKGILVISPDGTCRVGKQFGVWDFAFGYASIRFGKVRNRRYYELDIPEGTLTNHAIDGKALTKITISPSASDL